MKDLDLDLDAWRRNGFLVVPDVLDAETTSAMTARVRALVDAFVPRAEVPTIFTTNDQTRTSDAYFLGSGDDVRLFFEEEAFVDGRLVHDKAISINKIGHALHALDPVFAPFSQRADLRHAAAAVIGCPPAGARLVQSMVILKNPLIGGDVQCHQDATFLHTEPASVVGLWFALEDATTENGCMWALPGGHRETLRKRFARAPGGGTAMQVLDPAPLPVTRPEAPWVPLEAPRGTMVVLHGLLPHWSSANRSIRSRLAYALHFVDDRCRWSEDNWLRPAPIASAAG